MLKRLLPVILLILSIPSAFAGEALLHHELTVVIEPASHRIEVTDVVTLPAARARSPLVFLLHKGLEVASLTPGVAVGPVDDVGRGEGPSSMVTVCVTALLCGRPSRRRN